ncbi:MAG: ferrochelatase [Nitrososphaerales archaeon]|nr:ferrochelatase [Nitrososphaerales archaeon]
MKAVVLMAYGTPRSMKDVEAYYTHIRGGRKPTPEELDNLIERYEAIGGTSPLIEITERERAGLESSLRAAGSETKVYAAMKHSPPFVADVVKEASEDGAEELLALALAPHYSRMSVGSYISSVKEANEGLSRKMKLSLVESWHDNPVLIRVWSDRIRDAASRMAGAYWLVFSAHSLPERILSEGDPYKDQLLHTCGLITHEVGKKEWSFSFQSAGHTPEPWLGPDLVEHLESLRGKGETRFLIAPVGFVSDHLEILYDIDVECSQWARDSGVSLSRCRSLNDSKEFVGCLFSIVKERGFL